MASIPLPALDVRPPQQQENPLDAFGKVAYLKSLASRQQLEQGQVQLQNQQIKDQQAMTKAWQSWDGQDPDKLIKGVLANGGSGQAANQLEQTMMARQSQKMQLSTQQFELEQKKNDRMLGRLDAAKGVSDDQLADHVKSAIDESVQSGDVNPQDAQNAYQFLQKANGDPKAIRQGLDNFEKLHQLDSVQFARAKEQSETQKNTAQASEAQAATEKTQAETGFYEGMGLVPGVTPEMAQYADYIKNGGRPENYKASQAAKTAQAEIPARVATAQALQPLEIQKAVAQGQAVAQMHQQIAAGSNAALANVPEHLIGPATQAATKAGEDYAQAQSVTQRLQAMMDAAKSGNVVSYQLIPQEGALQVTTSQGVHRINMAEIQNYGGGSLWQRLQGHIGKALTGQSIPASVLSDMAQMQKIQQEGSQSKYENTLKTINQNYGSKFQPVDIKAAPATPDNTQSSNAPRQLTDINKARAYLQKAGGDKAKARALAKQDNWTF